MRRVSSLSLVVAGCCMVPAWGGSPAFGSDQIRSSVFRVLTSEQSEGPAMTAPVEEDGLDSATAAARQSAPQAVADPRMNSGSPEYLQSPGINPVRTQVGFYGNNTARQTTSQFPRRPSIQTNARRSVRQQAKPFTGFEHEPTLSPYLILDEDEDDAQNVPSYLTQVRPRVAQLQTNRVQQREIQQLRGQVQTMTTHGGASSRYMNTAQFYGGMR